MLGGAESGLPFLLKELDLDVLVFWYVAYRTLLLIPILHTGNTVESGPKFHV
jgi:hypothetical protein